MYAVRIGEQPLSLPEVDLLHQADLVGSGASGFPLFFHVGDERWLQPVAVYVTSLVSLVTGPQSAGRLAAATVGALNVALIFVLFRRLLTSTAVAAGAALLLMATPAHIVFARVGVDAIYPLPFVLAWLIATTAYFDAGDRRLAGAGAFALGLGVYSHPSAPITMGFLLAIALLAIWLSGRRSATHLAVPVAAFLAPLLLAVGWFMANPSAYPDTFGRWVIHAAHLVSPLDGTRAFVNWNTLGTRVSLYWGFFDPSWLFFDAASPAASPLRGASPFLFATMIGLVAGVSQRLRAGFTPVTLLLLAGLAGAPLAASTFGEARAIGEALVVAPFVTVVAAGGLANWLAHGGGWTRMLAWGLLAALLIEGFWSVASYSL